MTEMAVAASLAAGALSSSIAVADFRLVLDEPSFPVLQN
jgi:hypothetical protein